MSQPNPIYDHLLTSRRLVASDAQMKCNQFLAFVKDQRLRTENVKISRSEVEDFIDRECTDEQKANLSPPGPGFIDFGLDFRNREGLEKIGRIRCSVRNAGGGADRNLTARLHANRIFALDEFGLESPYLERSILALRRGLVLIDAPMNMGKSALNKSYLQTLCDTQGTTITSFEDPIELLLKPSRASIEQIEIPTDVRSIKDGIIAVKRTGTRVISVTEARRAEEKEAVVEASRSMLTFTTGHGNDSITAVEDFIETVPEDHRDAVRIGFANTLQCIIAMRQFPRKRRLNDQELEGLRIGERQNVVHAFEITIATDAIRNIIRTGDYSRIRNQITGPDRLGGSRPLEQHMAELVLRGEIEEADARAEACSEQFFESEMKRAQQLMGRTA